jgi:hypothetical protein
MRQTPALICCKNNAQADLQLSPYPICILNAAKFYLEANKLLLCMPRGTRGIKKGERREANAVMRSAAACVLRRNCIIPCCSSSVIMTECVATLLSFVYALVR